MKKFLMILSFIFMTGYVHAALQNSVAIIPTAALIVSSAPTANSQSASVTISSPTGSGAYSTGYYNYVSDIHVVAYATATITGSGTPLTCTLTGFPINPVITMETAMAIGTMHVREYSLSAPLQALQNTQVTLTCPSTTNVLWNIQMGYFVGP